MAGGKKKTEAEKVKNVYCGGRPFDRIRKMVSAGATFSYYTTNRTTKVYDSNYRFIYANGHGLPLSTLHRQKKLKKQFLDNIIAKNLNFELVDIRTVWYFRYSDKLLSKGIGESFDGELCGFDIVKAYYTVARNLGLLNEDFYNECLTVDKKERLRLIGSIATKKDYRYYEGGKLVAKKVTQEDPRLINAWNTIVKHVDNIMAELVSMCRDKYIMYWFDGAYFNCKHSEIQPFVDLLSEKYNIEFTPETVTMAVIKKEEHSTEPFLSMTKSDKNGVLEEKKFYIRFNFKKQKEDLCEF